MANWFLTRLLFDNNLNVDSRDNLIFQNMVIHIGSVYTSTVIVMEL